VYKKSKDPKAKDLLKKWKGLMSSDKPKDEAKPDKEKGHAKSGSETSTPVKQEPAMTKPAADSPKSGDEIGADYYLRDYLLAERIRNACMKMVLEGIFRCEAIVADEKNHEARQTGAKLASEIETGSSPFL